MKTILLVVLITVTGCASTGIIPTGQDTFMLAKTSPACGFRSADGTKADLYIEANAYCAKQKKQLVTVNFTGRDGIILVRCASAELEFRCVAEESTK